MAIKISGVIILISVVCAIFTGNVPSLTEAAISGGTRAVTVAFSLLPMMCLWCGIMKVAEQGGILKAFSRLLSPLLRLIFPKTAKSGEGLNEISTSLSANVLGIGNAATPLGIEAMRRIKDQSGSSLADNETVRFVVINSAALTLLPTTVAALRASAGSTAPFSIIIPVWLTGGCALAMGLLSEKLISKR